MDGKLQKLITDSQAGNRQAQEQLILAVQNHVYYHCCKMLRNEDDALDATQEILISLLRGLPSLREPAAFWPWLNQITCRFGYKQHARRRLFLPFRPSAGRRPSVRRRTTKWSRTGPGTGRA